MTLQLDFKNSDLLSLEDAIAYEFFMDSASNIMHSANEKDLDIAVASCKTCYSFLSNRTHFLRSTFS